MRVISVCLIFFVTYSSGNPAYLSCEDLPLVPPTWSYNHTDLPLIALFCNLTQDSEVDIYQDILSKTQFVKFQPYNKYVELNIFFKSYGYPYSKLDFKQSQQLNTTLLTKIGIQNCNITWDALDRLGTSIYLTALHIIMVSDVWDLGSERRDYIGLHNLTTLQYSFHDIYTSFDLVNYFPPISLNKIGRLDVQCRNHTVLPTGRPYCDPGFITFNITKIHDILPHIQSLVLLGIYPTSNQSVLSFPWDENMMSFPFNLSLSRYQSVQCANQNCYNNFLRLLKVKDAENSDIFYGFSKLYGSLDYFSAFSVNLKEIPEELFSGTPNLTYIGFCYNRVAVIPEKLFSRLFDLQILDLRENLLQILEDETFDDLINLKVLDLSGNRLRSLNNSVFSKLVSLERIRLAENRIAYIDHAAFPIFPLKLTYIDLRRNNLSEIPPVCLSAPNIEMCDCDYNTKLSFESWYETINDFDPITLLFVDALAYYGETYDYFTSRHPHTNDMSTISVKDSGISKIPYNSSWSLNMKKQLAAFLSYFQILLNGDLICDCDLYDFKNFVKVGGDGRTILLPFLEYDNALFGDTNFLTWICKPYPILSDVATPTKILEMPDDMFLCQENSSLLPSSCNYYRRPVNGQFLIDCSNNSLSEFPKNLPVPQNGKLYMVNLESNNLTSLVNCDDPQYYWLKHVQHLILRRNSITPDLSSALFEHFLTICLANVTYLDLSDNNVQYLPVSISVLNLSYLNINSNKFVCDCRSLWMKKWLQGYSTVVHESWKIRCPSKVKPIVQMEDEDFKCESDLIWSEATVSLGAMFLVVIIAGIAAYTHRHDIKVIIFEKLSFHPFDKQSEAVAEYDAYLMYHDDDHRWVQNVLLVGLELKGYRVYDRNRDSTTGLATAQEVAMTLQNSHRVLVVLTQNFYRDHEMMNCFFRADDEGNTRALNSRFIIIIKKCSNEVNINEELLSEGHAAFGRYLRTDYFVDVYSKRFWSRLFYWMPLRKVTQLPDAGHWTDSEMLGHQNDDESGSEIALT